TSCPAIQATAHRAVSVAPRREPIRALPATASADRSSEFASPPAAPAEAPLAPVAPSHRRPKDDREKRVGNHRTMLVVEDDEAFAGILYELAHELNFQCLIATSGEEALALAAQYAPSAIVLDIGLPDQSGLAVLDRLKQDSRTRHIPVHVVSGSDYAET